MNWQAKYRQQRLDLLATFYTFIAMALIMVRAGMHARGIGARELEARGFYARCINPEGLAPLSPQHEALAASIQSGAQPDIPSYEDVCRLLCMAQIALWQLEDMTCAPFELMNQAHMLARSQAGLTQTSSVAGLSRQPPELIDTS